ncbi:MAG: hypothetical protein JO245_10610 [Pseudolabrys sp.]|nr:hypothetical protein [Pseudolabrys sp.]
MTREMHMVFGALLGVCAVLALIVFGFDWGVERVKTAAIDLPAPILFQPK